MDVGLAVTSGALTDESLAGMVRDLRDLINRETGVNATVEEGEARTGDRGEIVTLGTLALTFLSSGAAVALFEVFKAIFERNSSIKFEFDRGDGQTLKIAAENLSDDQIEHTIQKAKEFLGE